jgi:hypothetical protein
MSFSIINTKSERYRTEYTNIFNENENRKDVKNNIKAAPFN